MGLALELALRVDTQVLDVPVALTTFAGAALLASSVPDHWASAYVAGLAVAVASSPAAGRAAPALLLPVMCAGVVGAIGGDVDCGSVPASWRWRSARRSPGGGRRSCGRQHLAAGLAVVAMPFGLFAIGATPSRSRSALLIVAVVLTGTSFLLVSSVRSPRRG